MLQKLLQEAKGNRRDYVASVMKNVLGRSTTYSGAQIGVAPGSANGTQALKIKLTKSTTDLQRFKSLTFANRYLYLCNNNGEQGQVFPID